MASTLLQAWTATARAQPGALAVVDAATGRSCTRRELAEAAAHWRSGLPPRPLLRGRCVAIAEPNGLSWWHLFLGLLEAGAIPASLDSTEPPAVQRAMAESIGATFLCTANGLEHLGPGRRIRQPDACLIKVTSGSTGRPSARWFTHGQMLADGAQVCATMGITPDDVNLAVIPLGHSYALGNIVVPLLAQGTAVVCAGSPLPHVLETDTARWRPTVFPSVPTLLRALVRADVDPRAFASLRLVISAGAVLPPELAASFAAKFGRRVHGFYGSSETGGITYDRSGDASLSGRSVGTPLTGVRVEARPDRRFRVHSAAVCGRGSFSPADRAVWNTHSELSLLGRAGRTVKVGGRRLDLGEVESALRALLGVRDAFVAGDQQQPDRLIAAVCTQRPPAELRAELRTRLAPWKVPDRWVALLEFPTTARGKTDTRQLQRLLTQA
jgi:acyl-coenzyme A synthetase/AMP-(fatty) acid ligase